MRKKPLDAIVNDYENEYEIVLKIKYDEKADYCFVASFCFKTNEETISFTVDKNSKVDSFIINGEAFTRVMKETSVSYMSYRPGFPLFEEMNDRDLWVNPLFEFMQKICYSSEIEFKNSDFKVFNGIYNVEIEDKKYQCELKNDICSLKLPTISKDGYKILTKED